MTWPRWLAGGVLIVLAIFAWQGGNFSQPEYTALRREAAGSQQRIAALHREIDSLEAYRDSLMTSPAVQERVAREQWGWVRPGEMAFSIRAIEDSAR